MLKLSIVKKPTICQQKSGAECCVRNLEYAVALV